MKLPEEHKSRRDGYPAGISIRLANGEFWKVPIAVPTDERLEDGTRRWAVNGRLDPEIDEAIRRLWESCEDDGGELYSKWAVTMCRAHLLRMNYDISIHDGVYLLHFGFLAIGDFRGAIEAEEMLQHTVQFPETAPFDPENN